MISLFTAIVISLFAVSAGIMLLLRYREWRIGFMAGIAVFVAALVAMEQISRIFAKPGGDISDLGQYERLLSTLILSVLTLGAIFFLERILNARAEAENELQLAKASLDNADIPVFWYTAEGKIRYANKGARKLLGYSTEELFSKTIHDIAPSYPPDDWRRDWSDLKQLGSTCRELLYRRSDGQPVPVDVMAIHVGREGRELGCMFVRDITERKQAEASLQNAMGEVDRANRIKSEFLASMSHELRTPLNAINGFSEIIKNEIYGPIGISRYRDYAADIHNAGLHLLDLINDILDLSKVEAGAEDLHEEPIYIPELIESVLNLVRGRALNGNVTLETSIRNDADMLWADQRKVKQILINLMSNAIKYTLDGGRVTLKAWSTRESGYVFQAIDTGIGIAVEDIPKALSPFQQINGDINRKFRGTGLGLPLAKSLVEMHGGSMDLQSQIGVGTTVTVRFPAKRVLSAACNIKSAVMA